MGEGDRLGVDEAYCKVLVDPKGSQYTCVKVALNSLDSGGAFVG